MKKIFVLLLVVIAFASCEKERDCPGAISKSFDQSGFTRLKAGDNFNISVTKGNTYSVKATGCENDLNDIEMKMSEGYTLEINFKNYRPRRYNVDFVITTPVINALVLSGNAEGTLTGFANQQNVIRTLLSGNAKAHVNGAAVNAHVELSGNSVLNISGATLSLYGNISGNATLNSYPVAATEVDIMTSGNARAFVSPVEKLFVQADGQSVVKYKGNPTQKSIETSGNAKVIKE